ncbi:rho guanine nucleotide exchange factor 3-like isoform X2 [Venturia canescens]|uniref:rho guanine nucleotide exchange factor 3-like isoform X2 n=1 Tax=Venturia canescens TaxID=32260 RepID=UPI001C9D393B|nr:rho guanine nucleotide exchange factor 3-like isoform X2 [Venturia canescens]
MDDCDATLDETFQEPRKKFWQRSSRKRTKSDAISIGSMDVSLDSTLTLKTRKRRRITELASNFLFANSTSSRISNVLQRSFGGPSVNSNTTLDQENIDAATLRRRQSCEPPAGNLTIRSWITDVAKLSDEDSPHSRLGRNQIKRQEAIYELYCGENVLLGDLSVLRDFYYHPLCSTGIFTSDELVTLFGDLDGLIEIHSKLRDELVELRDSAGVTDFIGPTLLNWLPSLTVPYLDRCRSQVWARHVLDEKRSRSKRFQEFLKKKMELPRAVELWTYLDVARSRVVKYPLLVNEITRRTPSAHPDRASLKRASEFLADLLCKIDRAMGEAECELARSKIVIKPDNDRTGCIDAATELITEGPLKDSRGLKLHCFLFDTCFALTRRTIKSRSRVYNLSYPIIPREEIDVEESSEAGEFGFKIGSKILTTNGEHEKRHWIDAFEKAKRIANAAISAGGIVEPSIGTENARVI